MSTGFCPFADVRNIPPGVNDPQITPRLAILHVDAGNAESLFGWFSGPSGGVESHFFVKRDGSCEQYRSIYWQADANLQANDFAVSIETQGFGSGEWTKEQLATIKRLLLWLHDEADIPLKVCEAWNGSGVGYHVMFGAPGPWTPSAKTCPGPDRIAQFKADLVPWMAEASKPPPRIFPLRHRIVTANMYVKNPDPLSGVNRIIAKATAAFRFGPDAIAMQETQRMHGPLSKVGGYTLLVPEAEHGEAGAELAVLLQSGLKVLGVKFHEAADGTGEGVFAHPRGIFVVRYVKRGRKVAVVNTHMGVTADPDTLNAGRVGPAAEQHAEHALKVARLVARLQEAGYLTFVTADANARGLWGRDLVTVLGTAGLKVTRNNVDLIASDPDRAKAPDVQIVSRRLTGSDTHDAIAIRCTERKAR